jgi:hypothetical protein
MMSDIYGIDCAPLVLGVGQMHYFMALSGHVNDYRTYGAFFSVQMNRRTSTKGATSIALGNAQGIKDKIPLSTNGAKYILKSK